MSFYEYLVEVERIFFYNFLTEKEYESLYEKYEKYMDEKEYGFSNI